MYVKLFGSILDSSIWSADPTTRIVWITMLAMADESGIVYASLTGLARRAQVTTDQCRRALKLLEAPDRDDRSGVAGGRRIRPLQGAWEVINYKRYRELRSQKQVANAVRQAKFRKRHRVTQRDAGVTGVTSHDVTTEAEAEAETEAETTKSKALVAPKSGATGKAIMTEFQQLLTTQHLNGAARTAKAKLVFAYWAAKWDHPTAVYDGKRRSRLEARLKENGDNVSELLWVIDGAKRDDWTDRGKYAGIEQLFRDRGAVERLAGMAPGFRNGEPHPMAVKYAGVPEKPHAVG